MPPTNPRVPQRGEIWTVSVPGDPHAPRPCLIISTPEVYAFSGELLVVPIWTSAPEAPTRIRLSGAQTGLHHESVLMCDELIRIPQDWIGSSGPIGHVPIPILKQAMFALRLTLGEPRSVIEAERLKSHQK